VFNIQYFNNKIIAYWSLLILFLTAALSILLYKERVLYVDSALQVFEMINSESFSIYVGRYSMIINQCIPVLFIKLGAPLNVILISYSLGGVLISLFSFIVCYYIFKNKEAAITIASFIIMYRHAYFHAISETYYAMAYSALFYSCISFYGTRPEKSKVAFYLITFTLLLLNYFIHPITFFLLLFSTCFLIIKDRAYKKTESYIIFVGIAFLFISKFLFSTNGHENNFFSNLKSTEILTSLLNSYSLEYFFLSLDTLYLIPLLFFLLTLVLYIMDKEFLVAIFIFSFVIFFIIITAITFHVGDSSLALETRFVPLYFFIAIPLFHKLLQKNKWVLIVIMTILTIQLVITFSEIEYLAHSLFQKRMNLLTTPFTKYNQKKFLIHTSDVSASYDLIVIWATSVETLLYTSIEGKEHSKTLYLSTDPDKENPSYNDDNLFLLTPWWPFNHISGLNNKYFSLPNDPYFKIKKLE
jgi:hypothetical protein